MKWKFTKQEIEQVQKSFRHTRDVIENNTYPSYEYMIGSLNEFNEKANSILEKMSHHESKSIRN